MSLSCSGSCTPSLLDVTARRPIFIPRQRPSQSAISTEAKVRAVCPAAEAGDLAPLARDLLAFEAMMQERREPFDGQFTSTDFDERMRR